MADRLAPGLLIAMPQLLDPNFRQAVILLIEHDDGGSMGVIVNSESPLLLSELCHDQEIDYRGQPDKRVRRGGPVQPEQGLVVFGEEHQDPEGRPLIDGLHVSASKGTLERLCQGQTGGRFHCYSGYAGWGPGQLEREIVEGSWIVASAEAAFLFEGAPETIWASALHANGIDPAALAAGGTSEA